jgi:hypothetical protein
LSIQPDFLNGKDKDIYEDENSEFRSKLDNMLTPDEIDASKVGANRDKKVSKYDGLALSSFRDF